MTNKVQTIKLENIKNLSGKKDSKETVYFYLDFKFNLHKMGDSASGSSLFRIIPINFDNMLLKTFSKKTFPAKGFSTLESNNIKMTLKNTFDEIVRIKTKKELARKAYEKAKKDGTLPVEEVATPVEKVVRKGAHLDRKTFRKKIADKKDPKIAVDSYKTESTTSQRTDRKGPARTNTGNAFDKTFGIAKNTKKNEDFKRDRNFEKNESFNFDKEKKEQNNKPYNKEKSFGGDKKPYNKDKAYENDKKPYNKDKSYGKDKPKGKFDSRDKKKSFDREDSSNNAGINKFNKNSREFSKDIKEKNSDRDVRFTNDKNKGKAKPSGKSFSGAKPFNKQKRSGSQRSNF
ncbi:MAG: hypothetical protein ACRCWG_04745 [Sarcina sp.]